MRTALAVDDDLIGIIKHQARQRGVSFKTVVNEVIRTGLGVASRPAAPAPRVEPHSFGFKPGIDTEKLGQPTVLAWLEEWLALPQVHIAHPSARHFANLRAALTRLGTGGNLTTDAHLATLAIERGYILYSTDRDFARFPGLRWVNPLAGV